jgi:hypothetical protein
MPKAGTVETNNPAVARKKVHEPADGKILYHRAVAMEQHDTGGFRLSALNVVKADAIAFDKSSERSVPLFSDDLEEQVANDQANQDHGGDHEDNFCL